LYFKLPIKNVELFHEIFKWKTSMQVINLTAFQLQCTCLKLY
jgi:hypothetical protein